MGGMVVCRYGVGTVCARVLVLGVLVCWCNGTVASNMYHVGFVAARESVQLEHMQEVVVLAVDITDHRT